MNPVTKKFGENLKLYRKLRKYTQEDFAEKIGINLRQLAGIESGQSFVSSETLLNISSILQIPIGMLFDFNIKDSPDDSPESQICILMS